MFRGLGNIATLMKSAQELQGKMAGMQEVLGQLRVEGTAGGGMVVAEVTGKQELVRCRIEESLLATGDREMIEELVVAAVNQALDKSRQAAADSMSQLVGDLNLPGLGEALGRFGHSIPPL
jgi:hypothetical protein